MSKISHIVSTPHQDSQGGFTVKVRVELESGLWSWGAVPKGAASPIGKASSGESIEAQAIRAHGLENDIYPEAALAKLWADSLAELLNRELVGLEASKQFDIDEILSDYDAREFWAKYGINSMLAASIAVARVAALEQRVELFEYVVTLNGGEPLDDIPVPLVTVIEGGKRIPNDLDFQAIMLVPIAALSADEAHHWSDAVYFRFRDILTRQTPPLNPSVGEQGGFVPKFGQLEERKRDGWKNITRRALDLLAQAVEECGFVLGEHFCIAMDCAVASQPFDSTQSRYSFEKHAVLAQGLDPSEVNPVVPTGELIEFYKELAQTYAVWYIEDGLSASDEKAWQVLHQELGPRRMVVGDDLFYDKKGHLSPRQLLRKHATLGTANSALIMPNRAGTLKNTIQLIELARAKGYTPVMSVRARETEDDAVVDIAVACSVPFVKVGGLQCSERNSKFERLLFIESLIGPKATYGARSKLLELINSGAPVE
jgi:enolase